VYSQDVSTSAANTTGSRLHELQSVSGVTSSGRCADATVLVMMTKAATARALRAIIGILVL
jgi:20S proteasome alpha/beta subunit